MFPISPTLLRHIAVASCFAIASFTLSPAAHAADRLRIDEWGTFTALQDEHGNALPGINVDDEPLPKFCHNLHPWALVQSQGREYVSTNMKGAPERHPYICLRLETPVIYFHPPAGEKLPFSIDVDVELHGGWLTEFYPHARPDEPGLMRNQFNFGLITRGTVGSLSWKNVQVGTAGHGPETTDHVWLAPRNVAAADVTVGRQTNKDSESESERYLFYRGVANRPAPLRVSQDDTGRLLKISGQCADCLAAGERAAIAGVWLVHTRKDGTAAFRALGPITVTRDDAATLITRPGTFADVDFSLANMDQLRAQLHDALVTDGLFPDEAAAMLSTWEHAYFKSPGLRLFFLVPRTWTDTVLPLKFSRPADVRRVMMGRIELISPEQRQLLKTLATSHISDPSWLERIPDSDNARKFREGRSNFGELGVAIPADYQTYLNLGRFRNALLLAEQRVRSTPQLDEFINNYGLYAYQPK